MALFVCAIGFSQQQVSDLGTNAPIDYKHVTPNTNSHVRTNFDATSFTSETVRGTNVNIGEAGTATRAVNAVSITHSNTQTIEAGAEIACASPTSYRSNSIFRDFDLANDFGIAGDFIVTDAEVAIGVGVITPTGFPLTVNIYSTTTGTFPSGVLTLQGTATTTIFDTDSETMISLPVAATIPAGESMIYEVMVVDDGTDTNYMRFGANNDGQTGISYIMAADCGAPDPIDMAVAFGLTNSFVMNVIGDEDLGGGGDCSTSNPSNGFENGRGNDVGNGWTVATDIMVPMGSDMMLNQVTSFQFMTAGGATVVSADITIYDDNAGLPGATVISTENVVPTSNTVVGSNFGFDISEVVFDITPVALAGDAAMDMTYWVAIQVTTSDGATSFWENSTASMVGNPQAFSNDGGTVWSIEDATQESVYVFTADCSPIGGGGGCMYAEDFEAGMPAGWSTVVNTGTCDWELGMDLPTGDDFPTQAIFFDDDACGGGADASNVTLFSDVYDVSVADTYMTVGFDVAFQNAGSNDSFTIEVYDGAAWQQIAFYDADLDPDIQTESFDVFAYANADFQVRWTYDDDDSWGWHAGIDNFCLDFDEAPAPTCTEFEDFDAGLPAGWSTVINTGTCDWMNGVDLPTGGPLATPAMIFDDDACGSGADASNVTLMSDIYYTGNATYITLTYDVGFQEAGDQSFTVEVYDGTTWQQVAIYEDDLANDLETETIDVTAYANTDFQVRWTYDDGAGSWGWYAAVDNFCLDHDAILGTADNTIEGFNFYPNPSTNVVNVSAQDNIENVAIFNILGQKVIDQNIDATTSQINVSNLSTGTYIMKATVNGVTASYKLIKN